MNKKEVSEIKKHFKVDDDLMCMDKLLIAYIEGDGSIRYKKVLSRFTPGEDEIEYYYGILRNVLSTKVCKNLVEYEFHTPDPVQGSYVQKLLYNLRNSRFESDELVDHFVSHVATNSNYPGAYALIVANCRYTVFKKTSDDEENKYNSEDYNFLISAFCPITYTEPGFVYNFETESFEKTAERAIICKKPTDGFLFPAFCDRASDVNRVMYYTKDFKKPNTRIVDDVLGCRFEMSAYDELVYFKRILEDCVGDDLSYMLISSLNESISILVQYSKSETDPVLIGSHDLCTALESCGVSAECIDKLPAIYESYCGDHQLHAVNLIEKKITVSAAGASASVPCNGGVDIHIRPSGEIGLSTSEPTVEINGMTVSVN